MMMLSDPNPDMLIWVLIWLGSSAFLIYRHWRQGRGVGLMIAFVTNFGVLHGLAALLFLLPWFYSNDRLLTAIGMRVSALAILSAAAGAEFTARYLDRRAVRSPDARVVDQLVSPAAVNLHLAAGLALYSFIAPLVLGLPSLTALAGTGSALVVMSMGLKCWNAWQLQDYRAVWLWLAASVGFPMFTIVTQGFLGYGIGLTATFVMFLLALIGPRWRVIALSVAFGYVSLSVYCTYMRDRADIRQAVWGGSALSDRIDRASRIVTEFEWFDPSNQDHLLRVDNRMNQNLLVGYAVRYLASGAVPFAKGATMYEAVLNVVPRAIWPDKPMVAGSGNVVATYTGLAFTASTSVGTGLVMECYINFGNAGVVFGFLILGSLICLVDRSAVRALQSGDLRLFNVWYLPGLGLLNIGGSLVEQTATTAAAWAMAHILNYYITSRWPYMKNVVLERPVPVVVPPSGSLESRI